MEKLLIKDKISVFDFIKNETRTLVKRQQMTAFKALMNISDDYNDWWISDSQWVPDKEHFRSI